MGEEVIFEAWSGHNNRARTKSKEEQQEYE